jgi:hypothetical protein
MVESEVLSASGDFIFYVIALIIICKILTPDE